MFNSNKDVTVVSTANGGILHKKVSSNGGVVEASHTVPPLSEFFSSGPSQSLFQTSGTFKVEEVADASTPQFTSPRRTIEEVE